jgi:hypothetical protein
MEFVDMFLEIDFEAAHFIPKKQAVGVWPPKR